MQAGKFSECENIDYALRKLDIKAFCQRTTVQIYIKYCSALKIISLFYQQVILSLLITMTNSVFEEY